MIILPQYDETWIMFHEGFYSYQVKGVYSFGDWYFIRYQSNNIIKKRCSVRDENFINFLKE